MVLRCKEQIIASKSIPYSIHVFDLPCVERRLNAVLIVFLKFCFILYFESVEYLILALADACLFKIDLCYI